MVRRTTLVAAALAVVASGLVVVGAAGPAAAVPLYGQPALPGDVYVADPQHGVVWHIPGDGEPATTVGVDLRSPQGVAVDPDGNVYIADQPDHVIDVEDPPEGRLIMVSADGESQTVLADALYVPWGVAADAEHVYVSDFSLSGGVYRMNHDGTDPTTVATDAFIPAGLALDPLGNLFVADPYLSAVQKVPADGGPPQTLDAGVSFGWDVATDSAGDVLVSGGADRSLAKLPAGGGAPETLGPELVTPYAAAVDLDGNVLVADPGARQVTRFGSDGSPRDPWGDGLFAGGSGYDGPYDVAVHTPPPNLTPGTPPATGTVGTAYDGHTYTATGPDGWGDPTFRVASGTLPPGLTLDAQTGELSGTPTSAGDFTFRVQAENGATATVAAPATITVAKSAQTISFSSTEPADAVVGDTYTPTATSTASLPVTFSIAPASTSVCSIDAGVVRFDAGGHCVVRADQAGDDDHLAAPQVSQSIAVRLRPQGVVFTSVAPSGPRVGETYVPTASSTAGSSVVVTVGSGGACSLDRGVVTFEHAGTCVVQATTDGDSQYGPSTATQTIGVQAADTETAVEVTRETLSATVTVVDPGAGIPDGDVEFAVDGVVVGTAPLGVAPGGGTSYAVLDQHLATGSSHTVTATYLGDGDFATSTGTAERDDPTITAAITSKRPKRHGWFRTPVSVTFTCSTTTAPLVAACPAPVVLRGNRDGSDPVVGAVTADDGGAAEVVVAGVRIDRTAPKLHVRGVEDGATYTTVRKLRCDARDRLSGVASCTVKAHRRPHRVVYRAVAFDRAGNKTVVRGRYILR